MRAGPIEEVAEGEVGDQLYSCSRLSVSHLDILR